MNTAQKQATHAVAKVNNVPIVYVNDENQNVPIKPICEALGIDVEGQNQKLKRNRKLSSVTFIIKATGADGKEYEMTCLPYKYIFGWLFTIDISRVNPEAQEAVEMFQNECYDALYEHFIGARKFLELKEKATSKLIDQYKKAKNNFSTAKSTLKDAEDSLEELAKQTYQEYIENNRQLKINFVFANEQLEEGGAL